MPHELLRGMMGEAKRKRREECLHDQFKEVRPNVVECLNPKCRAHRVRPDGLWNRNSRHGMDEIKRREARYLDVEELMSAQNPALTQDDIPANLNVFATMEAAWNDLVDRWFHEGMPDRLQQDAKFIFYHGVQAAANLCIYCEGQGMFGAAADQLQADCIAYEKEAEAVLAERKAEEWRTGEI
jgi:hypothetical protein